MQISNPVISQYISGSVNRNQQADRLPARPVIIEGQLEDEKKRTAKKPAESPDQNYTELQKSENSTAAQLITPASTTPVAQPAAADNISSALLIQQQKSNSPAASSGGQSISSTQNFPYGSRRSFAGISGGSLVIQKYLNNAPESPLTAGQNSTATIDLFI